jgi:hypothetical protein
LYVRVILFQTLVWMLKICFKQNPVNL